MDCIFCKIIAKEIPSKTLAESSEAIAIADLHPQAPFHALILPKKHFSSLNDLDENNRALTLGKMYDLADQIAQEHGFREEGYRAVINNGKNSGQTVFHLHLHILAKTKLKERFGG